MSLRSRLRDLVTRPHLRVIAAIGVIVPRRLRADWRDEWHAELQHRESRLARWDRLTRHEKWELFQRSLAAFWDALWLQRRRLEDDLVQDVRFGLRMLVARPTFTCLAVLTLALAIGANTVVFTFVNALLLRPLPGVAAPQQLVRLGRQFQGKPYPSDSSYPDFLDYRQQAQTLSGIAAMSPRAFHLTTDDGAVRVEGELVSGNYFEVLGVAATRGRVLEPIDDSAAGAPVVVVSDSLWRRHFAGRASLLGGTIRLDGRPFTVVGIVDGPFAGVKIGSPRDIWMPLEAIRLASPGASAPGMVGDAAIFERRSASWLEMFGRRAPGVTLAQTRAELTVMAARLAQSYPATNRRVGISVEAGLGRDVETQRPLERYAVLPFVAVGLVLLIACANVAGLLLVRMATRRREIALRVALGAGRLRIVRQLLTESLLLVVASSLAGLAVATWLTRALRGLLPERLLFLSFDLDFGVDWRVFGFVLGVGAIATVLCGLVPGLLASRHELGTALKTTRGAGWRHTTALRSVLVVAQIALSVILLVAASLCVRTLINATAIETGYDTAGVLTARMDFARQHYDEARGREVARAILERLHAVPGIEAAAFAATLPLNDGRWEDAIRRDGDPTRLQTFQNVVTPRYFDVMAIPIAAGREFSDRDDERAPRVAIVNQTLARVLWPDASAIGRRVTFDGRSREIVGIVHDIKGRNLFDPPGPMLYVPQLQSAQPNVVLHVRSTVAPPALVTRLRHEVQAVDPYLPVFAVMPLGDHVTATLTPQRVLAFLIGGFGLLALVLAGTGLYGLLAYSVTDRTREIGVRMALGAKRTEVVYLFVADGMKRAVIGIVLGTVVGCGVTPLMAGLLYGVSPLDSLTLLVVPAVLLVVALAACGVPAGRAARTDPTTALRSD
jgi:macrolide transport system ATP-binding/permease protein